MREGGRGSINDAWAPAIADEIVDAFGFSGGQATFDAMVEVSPAEGAGFSDGLQGREDQARAMRVAVATRTITSP